MKTEKNESQLRDKFDNFKKSFEKQSFRIGNRSIPLTTLAIYICCLCCAILIWANVSETDNEGVTREFSGISVSVEGESALLKKGKAVFDVLDRTVKVTVYGSKMKVNSLSDDEITAFVDVSELDESGMVRLSVNVKGTGNLDTAVNPSYVKLFVDEKGEIDVPVVINSTYSIVSGYNFSVSSDVDTVAVSGAKNVLEKIASARVDADLGELTTGFTTTCGLLFVDSEGKALTTDYITPSIKSVLVSVSVFTEKTVPLTVSYKYGYIQPKNISVKLTPAVITLRGDPALLAKIESIALPEIDETKVTGDVFKAVTVNLPLGITDVNKTETFTEEIKLQRVEKRTISIPTSQIIVKNPGSINYDFSDKTIDVEYIVASDSKTRVKESDFVIEIDLSDYDHDVDGKYRISLSITCDNQGYTLYPINIGQIDVRITGTDSGS